RGARRRRSLDRGFPLSDHVDWPALLSTIDATGAERVLVTHGYREPVVRWLLERGVEAHAVASRWEGEPEGEPEGEGEAHESASAGGTLDLGDDPGGRGGLKTGSPPNASADAPGDAGKPLA
ncbi:MAG TPA: hypothetical protein VG432_12190, partial [Gemmatimonadaceae bacterium]|nr:hypothetical protein [Gemmatimonadaceae bacterium]